MGVALPWIFTDSALRPLGMRDTTRHAERGLLAPSIARRAPAGHRLLVRGVPGSLPERVPRSVTRRGPPARARPHRRDGVLRRLPEERRGGALLAAHASRAGERGRRGPHPPLIAALPSVALATGARDRYGRVAAAPVSCASWTRSPEGCEAPQARQRPRQAPELQPRVLPCEPDWFLVDQLPGRSASQSQSRHENGEYCADGIDRIADDDGKEARPCNLIYKAARPGDGKQDKKN